MEPQHQSSSPLAHMPQLDGLRAWACLAVLLSHFFPAHEYPVTGWFALGATGVRLFFVLSGFLITSILLREHETVEQATTTRGQSLRAFYVRRSLRIFPLYYAVLLVLFVMDYGLIRESIVWHLTYTENFWRVFSGEQFLNHFWSLCVEEHFYLVWPFVIFLIPHAWLLRTMVGFIVAAQLHRKDQLRPLHPPPAGLGRNRTPRIRRHYQPAASVAPTHAALLQSGYRGGNDFLECL